MIAFKPGANIGQLLDAEHELIGPGFRLQLHHECLTVPNHAFLQPITYVEEIVQKKQARAVGERKVRICLKQKDSAEIVMVDWGTQLFDVLSKIDLKLPFCCVQMPSQKIVSPGLRLLEDSTFFLEEFFVAQGKEEEHHDEWEYEPEREDEWLDDLPSEFGVLVKKVNEELKAAGKISVMTRYHGRGLDSLTIDIAGKAIIDLLPPQRKEHVWFLDPSLASDYMRDQPDIAEAAIRRYVQEADPREIFVMCAIEQHWLTLQLRWSSEELFVVGANAQSEELSPAVMAFIDLFKKALEVNRVVTSVENMLYQQKDSICGALALVHMANLAGLIPEISYQAAHDWYVTLRWGSHTFFRAEGDGKEEIQEWLRTFLPQKGVPESEVENRIQEAMAVIPVNALRKAKESTNPWRSMKVLTDKKGKTFRWVKEAELLKQVERKAESKYGVELQKKPKQPRNVTAEQQEPLRIDPNQIWLKKDGFVDSENKNVAQLFINEIKANGRGIAVMTATDAKSYIVEGRSISVDALALLTTSVIPTDLQGCRPHQEIRYSGIYGPTREPIILSGSLIQLGDMHVAKKVLNTVPQLNTIKTMTIKVHYFRDQAQIEWDQFCKRPVSKLQAQVPQLQVCQGKSCGANCPKWHRDVDGTLDGPILDVWGWFFQRVEGGKSPAKDAGLFTVMMRVPWAKSCRRRLKFMVCTLNQEMIQAVDLWMILELSGCPKEPMKKPWSNFKSLPRLWLFVGWKTNLDWEQKPKTKVKFIDSFIQIGNT